MTLTQNKRMKQKIKDFWWIFIEMGVPLEEIRRLVWNEWNKQQSRELAHLAKKDYDKIMNI